VFSPGRTIFAQMTDMAKKSTSLYWILFFLSLGLFVVVYLFLPSMISLTLVPITTFLVKALDII
jgi:hypothetical protein